MATMREEFEAYWKTKGGDLESAPREWGNGPNAYMWEDTGNAWRMWQESASCERKKIVAWLEPQRNDIPATGHEFSTALRMARNDL